MNCAAVYAEKRYSVQECDARDDPMENKCPVHKKNPSITSGQK